MQKTNTQKSPDTVPVSKSLCLLFKSEEMLKCFFYTSKGQSLSHMSVGLTIVFLFYTVLANLQNTTFSLSVYLSVYLSISLSVYQSICLSVCLFVFLSISLSVYHTVYLYFCLPISVCLSFCLPVCPSICMSVCLSVRL